MNSRQKARTARPSASVPTRTDGVIVRTVDGEMVIYDPANTATHALDPIATAVYTAVDGTRTPDDLTTSVSDALNTPVTGIQVTAALSDLSDAGLIHYPTVGVGRRRFLTVGAADGALGVPTVLSVIAPSPAAAQSDDGGTDGTTDGGGTGGGGVTTTTTTLPPAPVGNVTTLAGPNDRIVVMQT